MAEEAGVKVGVTIDGQATLKQLKQDLKTAQGEALAITRQFGETSKEAMAAAKRVAEIKDEVGDLNERVDLMDPGAKFQVFGNAVNAIAAGFTAAQGAMAAFGVESEDVEKSLLKVQGALALSQGLSALTDSWKDFERLGAVIKTKVVTAFSTLRGAIIATGIGALAVGIGLVIANFEKVEAWLKKIIPGFESFGAVFNKVKAIALGAFNAIVEGFSVVWDVISNIFTGDFSAAADAARNAGARIGAAYADGFNGEVREQMQSIANEAITLRVKYYDRELKVLRAQGEKSAAAVQEMERKRLETILKNTELTFEARKEAETELRAFDAAAASDREKAAQEAAKKAADDRKSAGQKALQELTQQQNLEYERARISGDDLYMLKAQQLQAQLELARRYGLEIAAITNAQDTEELTRRDKLNTALKESISVATGDVKTGLEDVGKYQAQLAQQQIDSQQKQAAADMAAAELKMKTEQGKQMAMEGTAALAESLAGLAGEQTAAGKALAIAGTTINTYQAAMQAYLNGQMIGGPWGIAAGIIAAAAAVATGIANVKRITSVKIPGGGGSGGSTPSGVSAPPVPMVRQDTGSMLDQLDQVNSNLNQPQRVQVVESDITNTQNRVEVIENNAKF